MKFLRSTLLIAVTAAFFLGCTKENTAYGPLTGKFVTSVNGDCLPVNVHGDYYANAGFTEDNYIDVQVDVEATGLFSIKTDTVNGMSFSASGRLGYGGLNTIRLYPSDSLAKAPGITTFQIIFDSTNTLTNTCTVDVTVLDPMDNPAVFTLGVTPGNCTGAVLGGIYQSGVALTTNNTIGLQVNVLATGGYNISTATVNGVKFTAVGAFLGTGPQSVTLVGSGVPTAQGLFNFPVTTASSNCSFPLAFSAGTGGPAAAFTLGGAPGDCTGAATAGTYQSNVPLTAANTVEVNVDVTTIGAYSITTNTVNGISFTKTASFTTTGPQKVILSGTGTPTAAGLSNYTLTAGAASCIFSVTATEGTTPPPPTADCKACTYQPWCNGMIYTQQTIYLGGAPTEQTTTISFIKDTTIDGKVFQKTSTQAGAAPTYYNCSNGVSTVVGYNVTTVSGAVTVSKLEQTLLKANEAVGATWTNTMEQPTPDPTIVQIAIYDWTLAEKIASKTVLGVTYSDVIRVHLILSSEIPGIIPKTKNAESDYYYAKGIGLIEATAINTQTGNTDFLQQLKTYFIP